MVRFIIRSGVLQLPGSLAEHRHHDFHELRGVLLISSLHQADLSSTSSLTSAQQISFFDSHEAIFEVAPEPRRLVTLHLPVLDRTPTQVLVQLGDVDGCGPLLILRRGVSDPVVDVSRLARALILTYLVKNPQTMEGRPLHTSGVPYKESKNPEMSAARRTGAGLRRHGGEARPLCSGAEARRSSCLLPVPQAL
ncbi:hypothetical protein EYF80_001492 [Liparis tanakae]|uniref:Uncharacterized protein n=1 Tax=Liparis tanakae TaxID=230148 RepID=A0A4Z2JDF1_9TELE|nr:hypothetical protein EYF80_001492 [Liparis tanakae]